MQFQLQNHSTSPFVKQVAKTVAMSVVSISMLRMAPQDVGDAAMSHRGIGGCAGSEGHA